MKKHILVTGGCGFVGSMLVPKLLSVGHKITVVDTEWFGNHLGTHRSLTCIKDDIRTFDVTSLGEFDATIHLANIANDPAVELNPLLSWEVNVLAGHQLISKVKQNGCGHFMFASSGSVYGIKSEARVTEDLELVPISEYNKTKMVAERVFLSYVGEMQVHCIRPATVCGWSTRMRLDVAVNMLTMQALQNGKITVFGGEQLRPNIHIDDMVNVYLHFLQNPRLESGCYNAGFNNLKIIEIAELIASIIPTEIEILPGNDPRSYNQCSDKLLSTGFVPSKDVEYAIRDLVGKYKSGDLVDNRNWHTVKKMMSLNIT